MMWKSLLKLPLKLKLSLNPNRSLEKLAFTLLEIHYNYDNNQAVCYNSEHNKSYHLTF